MPLEIGKKAPDFTLLDQDGKKVKLSDFKGKRVVVFFYPKAMTPGCTREACDFRDEVAAFTKKKVAVLGISKDTPAGQKKFQEKYELPFPLLSDAGLEVQKAWGVWGKKNMYGKMVEGTIRTTVIVGADGKVEQVFGKVKVDGHVASDPGGPVARDHHRGAGSPRAFARRPLRDDLVDAAVLEVLGLVREQAWLADRALEVVLRRQKRLYSVERRAAAEAVYGVLRAQGRIEWLLGRRAAIAELYAAALAGPGGLPHGRGGTPPRPAAGVARPALRSRGPDPGHRRPGGAAGRRGVAPALARRAAGRRDGARGGPRLLGRGERPCAAHGAGQSPQGNPGRPPGEARGGGGGVEGDAPLPLGARSRRSRQRLRPRRVQGGALRDRRTRGASSSRSPAAPAPG